MQVDDELFVEVVEELDLCLELMKNLLTDSQLDHVATVGSLLVSKRDVRSAMTLRDRWKVSVEVRDRAARFLRDVLTKGATTVNAPQAGTG